MLKASQPLVGGWGLGVERAIPLDHAPPGNPIPQESQRPRSRIRQNLAHKSRKRPEKPKREAPPRPNTARDQRDARGRPQPSRVLPLLTAKGTGFHAKAQRRKALKALGIAGDFAAFYPNAPAFHAQRTKNQAPHNLPFAIPIPSIAVIQKATLSLASDRSLIA